MTRRPAGAAALTVAVAVVAFNLRPAIAAVSPVLVEIERSTGLSAAGAGLLTTIPVLAFGACAALGPWLGRRMGIEAALVASLAVLLVGILVRSVPSTAPLFLGTLCIGVAVAVGNVLVPALIKRDFPLDPRVAMGVYSVALSGGAAVAVGVAVPVDGALGGWRPGLALWAAPVAVCLVLWGARLRDARHDIRPVHVGAGLWRDGLAWQVTFFMGLQSLAFYSTTAWLPTIFEQHGVGAGDAGWLLSLAGLASLPAAFVAPVLASSALRQRVAVVVTLSLYALALAGLLWHPRAGAVAWMILLGLAQGSSLALALTFIVARAPDAGKAAELSGMAQTIGYLVAGVGPLGMGALRDATGGWTVPLVVVAVVLAPQMAVGLGSARRRTVGLRTVGGPPPGDAA